MILSELSNKERIQIKPL